MRISTCALTLFSFWLCNSSAVCALRLNQTETSGAPPAQTYAAPAYEQAYAAPQYAAPAQTYDDDLPWPRTKFLKMLRGAVAKKTSKKLAVVVTTGAMNPVHKGHAAMLHQAAARLKELGYEVVGGWLSPSHDSYVLPKAENLGQIGLPAAFRQEVVKKALLQDNLVSVGNWEGSIDHFEDYPEVVINLQDDLSKVRDKDESGKSLIKQLNGRHGKPRVFYVCGTDHAEKMGMYWSGLFPRRGVGVVVVPRAGDTPGDENEENLVYVAKPAAGEVAGLSSTKVRQALARGDKEYVSKAMSAEAAQFMLQPSDRELKAYKDVYELLGAAKRKDSEPKSREAYTKKKKKNKQNRRFR